MKTINTKTQNFLFQLQAVSTVNNGGGGVTSPLNDIKKSLNVQKDIQLSEREFERERKRIAFNNDWNAINSDIKNIMNELVECANTLRSR